MRQLLNEECTREINIIFGTINLVDSFHTRGYSDSDYGDAQFIVEIPLDCRFASVFGSKRTELLFLGEQETGSHGHFQ